jgi:shikimate kinase
VTGPETRERPIWLVGMMGSGKTSVGPVLARLLGRTFVDNDRRVQDLAGRTIPEIFADEGEAAFRVLEARAIDDAARGSGVVALGGGAIVQPGAREKLAGLGTVVYLQASLEELLSRVGRAANRPLLSGLDEDERRLRIERMLADREDAYRSATIVVETDAMTVEGVAQEIVRALSEGESGGELEGESGSRRG